MIVVCEGCNARFKFDENRIKPGGMKVHCSKCRHTFVLMPPDPGSEVPAMAEGAAGDSAKQKAESGTGPAPAADEGSVPPEEPFDDPLADVPGFDPDDRAITTSAEDEQKALAELSIDEDIRASVEDALQRFQAGEATDEPPDPDEMHSTGQDTFSDLDPFGVSELVDKEKFGPGTEDAGSPGEAGEADAFGEEPANEGRSVEAGGDNFDWDQVSFTPHGSDTAVAPASPARTDPGPRDDVSDQDGDAGASLRASVPKQEASAVPGPPESEGSGLEFDLSKVSGRRPARIEMPAPPEISAPPPASRAQTAGPQGETPQPRAALQQAQSFRSRARQQRPRMDLPGPKMIVCTAALGFLSAVAGVLLALGNSGGTDYVARPAGGGSARAALVIEETRGVMVDRLEGSAVYLVTGKARWTGEPERAYLLKGVITGADGKVLERRTARIGPVPDWQLIQAVDPELFSPSKVVPREGDVPFSILFTPDPTWRGDVRFELVAGG